MVNSYNYVKDLSYSLRKLGGITLRTNLDPLEQICSRVPPSAAVAEVDFLPELDGILKASDALV